MPNKSKPAHSAEASWKSVRLIQARWGMGGGRGEGAGGAGSGGEGSAGKLGWGGACGAGRLAGGRVGGVRGFRVGGEPALPCLWLSLSVSVLLLVSLLLLLLLLVVVVVVVVVVVLVVLVVLVVWCCWCACPVFTLPFPCYPGCICISCMHPERGGVVALCCYCGYWNDAEVAKEPAARRVDLHQSRSGSSSE